MLKSIEETPNKSNTDAPKTLQEPSRKTWERLFGPSFGQQRKKPLPDALLDRKPLDFEAPPSRLKTVCSNPEFAKMLLWLERRAFFPKAASSTTRVFQSALRNYKKKL